MLQTQVSNTDLETLARTRPTLQHQKDYNIMAIVK